MERGDPATAEDHAQRSLALLERGGDQARLSIALSALGRVAVHRGALHQAEAGIAQRLAQGKETTAANTAAAAPRAELIHPGVRRYLGELGLLTR